MQYMDRNEIKQELNRQMPELMDKYGLEDIGIYEEEGPEDSYYFGYTVRKDGKVFMINLPYVKNDSGELAIKKLSWTIQTEQGETKGCKSLDEVFTQIERENVH